MPGFSLSETTRPEIINFFNDAIEKATNNVLTVFKSLYEISSKEPWYTVNNRTREFAGQYEKEFRNKVLGMMQQWCEEDYSVQRFAESIEGIDEATMKAARELEGALKQGLVDGFQKHPEVYNGSDLLDVADIDKLFAEIDQVLQTFKKQMEECISHTDSEHQKKGDNNEVYKVVWSILKGILYAYQSFFNNFSEGMSKNLFSHVADINKAAMGTTETSTEHLKVTGENVGDLLKEVSSLWHLSSRISNNRDVNTISTVSNAVDIGIEDDVPEAITVQKAEQKSENQECSHQKELLEEVIIQENNEIPVVDIYSELINVLKMFDSSKCCYNDLKSKFNKRMTDYQKKIDEYLMNEFNKLDDELRKLFNKLNSSVLKSQVSLQDRYVRGTINWYQACAQLEENKVRAMNIYNQREWEINQRKQYLQRVRNAQYVKEENRCRGIVREAINSRSTCAEIYKKKQYFCEALSSEGLHENEVNQLKTLTENAKNACKKSCGCLNELCRVLEVSIQAQEELVSIFDDSDLSGFVAEIQECQKIVDSYIDEFLSDILPEDKKLLSMVETVLYLDDEEFEKKYTGKKDISMITGFNDGKMSYVKSSGPYPKKTAIHEHIHELSCSELNCSVSMFKENGEEKLIAHERGIKGVIYEFRPKNHGTEVKMVPSGKAIYEQANEGLTEFFCKKMMGDEYPENSRCSYLVNTELFELMESSFGLELLTEAYFCNKPELIKNRYDGVMGQGEWDLLAEYMDGSLLTKEKFDELKNGGSHSKFTTQKEYIGYCKLKAKQKANEFVKKCGGNIDE